MAEETEKRQVLVTETAIKRAEEYIDKMRKEKGISLSRGAVFAMGVDLLVKEG